QGMPKQGERGKPLPRWAFLHSYPLMSLEVVNGERLLKVQPWKFMNKVLELWDSNLGLIRASGSFPWASIGTVPE
ncbi:MAG: hypothetical protein Q8P59_04760, partial [Dehalococcoidia bacterium]|nr:hypothetical protein [Dehalococcoidia bacterium]